MMINPSREQYKPEDDLRQAGTYLAVCTDVRQGIDWPDYPGKTRIAIQFAIADPRYPKLKGKKTAIVCGESVYRPRSGGTPSHLYTYAVQMGVDHPERGFDPEQFVNNQYMVTCELYNGKAMVRSAFPAVTMPASVPYQPQTVEADTGDDGGSTEHIPF